MNEKEFETELKERFKTLDAQIKVPEIPDAQSIFERAEKEKKVVPLRFTRYAAVATAVLIFCVSVPAIVSGSMMGAKSEAPAAEPMEAPMMFMYDDLKSEETEGQIEENCITGGDDIVYSVESSEAPDEANVATSTNGSNDVYGALWETFYRELDTKEEKIKENPSTGGGMTDPFSEELGKKRRIDVDIVDGSVSVILYDTSGKEEEILTAFWIEGAYSYSKNDGKNYIIQILNAVTEEKMESGCYMPMIGDEENGNYYLPEDKVTVESPVTEAVFHITVTINIESGKYDVSAVLK